MFSRFRLNVIFLIFAIFLSLIFRELFILQIINNDENTQDIVNQNFETFYISAPRGEILDLNGNKLAESILEPYLFLNQKKINEENITIYKQFISFNFNDLTKAEIDNFFSSNELFVEIANLNDYETGLRIKIQGYEAFEIFNQPKRVYVYKELFSHVIGYIGKPNQDELIEYSNAFGNKTVGKNGLERYYENILSGKPSEITLQNGEIVEITPAVPGKDIQITVDVNAQEVVKESLQQGILLANKSFDTVNLIERGAVVVQKIDTGEITAMVSLPDFDPNQFVSGISEFEFKKLNRTQAFNNFAIQGLYPPGSVFKVVAYWLAVNEGIFPEDASNSGQYVNCEGSLSFGFDDGSKQVYQDWKPEGHGRVNLSEALKHSKELGFSSLSKIDLPFEKEGVIPDRELFEDWKISKPELVRPEGWLGGDLMNLIIGQGAITTTPIQVSNAYRALLTGIKSNPYLFNGDSNINEENINISSEFINFLLDDLNLVTNPGGTAYRSFQVMGDLTYDIGGKTGTAQNAGDLNNTSWFVGVDSISNPKYLIVTVVEEGGSGSAVAAPVSRRIIQYLLEENLTPVEFGEITE